MHSFFVCPLQDFDNKCLIYRVCTIVYFFNQEKILFFLGIKQVVAVYHI
jgi:hypothetical protein